MASGSSHRFRVLVDDNGAVAVAPTVNPPCSEHHDSKVVRWGTYGVTVKRQSYKCHPKDGSAPHKFTMPLPRAQVEPATVLCSACEEFVGVHRGTQASARHAKWSLASVVDALADLAKGGSYAQVSLNVWDRTKQAEDHARTHNPEWQRLTGSVLRSSSSLKSEQGRAAWHVAADFLEQYSPVLYAHVSARTREREHKQRVTNNRVKADGKIPAEPITYVLDEVPIYVRLGGKSSRVAWTIHAVAEVLWRPGGSPERMPRRETRLRLLRALPGQADESSWRLVLQELETIPDVLIADFGSAIKNATTAHYRDHKVSVIPSLFHFTQALQEMFEDTPGFRTRRGRTNTVLPEVQGHLRMLSRDSLVRMGAEGWHRWWDDLVRLAGSIDAPLAPVLNRRELHEDAFVSVIEILADQPFLPASNAGVELRIRSALKPLLKGRQQRFRNISRTNALLDLLVCHENGIFNDTDLVARLIKDDNLKYSGWATPQRSFNDPQPPPLVLDPSQDPSKTKRKRYSSLLDTGLVTALLEQRADAGAET